MGAYKPIEAFFGFEHHIPKPLMRDDSAMAAGRPAMPIAMPSPRLRPLLSARARAWLAATALLLRSACSTLHPAQLRVGQTEAEVLAAMGQPTGRYALDGGAQRLEFARGPAGRVTWMVDLDAGGRLAGFEQVLDADHFALVRDGMPRDDLLRRLGRPAARQGEWQGRETWSWRYETHDCLWARVTLGADGRVQGGVAIMTDPACDAGRGAEPR